MPERWNATAAAAPNPWHERIIELRPRSPRPVPKRSLRRSDVAVAVHDPMRLPTWLRYGKQRSTLMLPTGPVIAVLSSEISRPSSQPPLLTDSVILATSHNAPEKAPAMRAPRRRFATPGRGNYH